MSETDFIEAETVVRRALYDRLPASAFKVKDHVDWVQVGPHWIDFQKLCDGIVADLQEHDYIARID